MLRVTSLVVVLTCFSCSQGKHTKEPTQKPLLELTANIENGKLVYASCAPCHGSKGEGNAELKAPALVNSETWYLHRQLTNFRKGIRGYAGNDTLGRQMAAVAKTLQDTLALADVLGYIATLPDIKHSAVIQGDIEKGKRTYETVCGSCHGQNATANQLLNAPGLRGLEDWYLRHQVNQFKSAQRGNHPEDPFGGQMVQIMALLKDEQAIVDVIAYIRSTEPAVK